jgi:uncharacterized NAD-dependent epimerase/dehydratase family protein
LSRRTIILTEGHSDPHTAKTACSVIRYRSDEVVAVLDSTQCGNNTGEVLGVGAAPFVSCIEEAGDANTLLIGIAPPGGRIPDAWRAIVLVAISRGMNVVSGLHDFLADDDEFAQAADDANVSLIDVRRNNEKTIARRVGLRDDCFRLLTMGHDCSVGKMVTSIEIADGLKKRGVSAKFVATGQTGIMVEGDGLPIDCITADFVSGAAEKLVLENQHHDVLCIEGQGSLVHPSYSAVTLGLLHGCFPHALVLCYEVLRDRVTGIPHMPVPPLAKIKELNEMMAGFERSCPTVAISMNSRRVDADEAEVERRRVEDEFGLPVCDVFRDGPEKLVDAVQSYRASNAWREATE